MTVSGLEVPHVETFQTSTEVTAGSQMELVCAVSGKPQPTVYWTKGTDRIEPNKGTGLPGFHPWVQGKSGRSGHYQKLNWVTRKRTNLRSQQSNSTLMLLSH